MNRLVSLYQAEKQLSNLLTLLGPSHPEYLCYKKQYTTVLTALISRKRNKK